MRLSSHRENEVLLQLSGFRYLTEPMIEAFLFGGSSVTPLSRQVLTRRVLGHLKRKGMILETHASSPLRAAQRGSCTS